MSIKKSQAILKCFIDPKISANLNYHMSIKKSQAILKCFIDPKSTVWSSLLYAGLRGRNHVS